MFVEPPTVSSDFDLRLPTPKSVTRSYSTLSSNKPASSGAQVGLLYNNTVGTFSPLTYGVQTYELEQQQWQVEDVSFQNRYRRRLHFEPSTSAPSEHRPDWCVSQDSKLLHYNSLVKGVASSQDKGACHNTVFVNESPHSSLNLSSLSSYRLEANREEPSTQYDKTDLIREKSIGTAIHQMTCKERTSVSSYHDYNGNSSFVSSDGNLVWEVGNHSAIWGNQSNYLNRGAEETSNTMVSDRSHRFDKVEHCANWREACRNLQSFNPDARKQKCYHKDPQETWRKRSENVATLINHHKSNNKRRLNGITGRLLCNNQFRNGKRYSAPGAIPYCESVSSSANVEFCSINNKQKNLLMPSFSSNLLRLPEIQLFDVDILKQGEEIEKASRLLPDIGCRPTLSEADLSIIEKKTREPSQGNSNQVQACSTVSLTSTNKCFLEARVHSNEKPSPENSLGHDSSPMDYSPSVVLTGNHNIHPSSSSSSTSSSSSSSSSPTSSSYNWPRPVFYGVIDGQFEQLCRQFSTGTTHDAKQVSTKAAKGFTRRRSRVIFCRVCQQCKPRSTRARFQSCDHIACYDCVRVALHVEFWAVKNNYQNPPRASCPVCRATLDWSTIKPYIVLAEESKYCPVLSLAAAGKDIPPNTPSYHSTSASANEKDAQWRFEEARKVVEAFFPKGVPRELLISDVTDYSQPAPLGCAQQLFGDVSPDIKLIDLPCVEVD